MAEKGYYLSEQDAVTLKRALEQFRQWRRNTTGRPGDTDLDLENQMSAETYIAKTPYGGIPALTEQPGSPSSEEDIPDQPGYAECTIYKIIQDESEPELEEILGGSDKLVYNISVCAVAGNEWVLITRDKFGSWMVVDPCHTRTTTTTSTTTTTGSQCGGYCIWECTYFGTGTGSGTSDYIWELLYDACGERVDTGTGTGTTPSTECNCTSPIYCCGTCGTTIGAVTRTSCARISVPTQQPLCYSTTSTTTGTTTTATTTTGPDCTGCYWKCLPDGWDRVYYNCSGDDCYPCTEPTEDCDDPDCEEAYTPCQVPPGTTTTTPYCTGQCWWWWDQPTPNDEGGWIPYLGGVHYCSWNPQSYECYCPIPSFPGDYCGSIVVTLCFHPESPTTTVFGDTTTLPQPFTTTSPGPTSCTGNCLWEWSTGDTGTGPTSTGHWSLICTNCSTGYCICGRQPAYDGLYDGETASVICENTTTGTTTSTTTTTTTSTTTTTTTTLCGECDFQCTWDGTYWSWELVRMQCEGPCVYCSWPQVFTCSPNSFTTTVCSVNTTTTTTFTTATTTTTTTTPACTTTACTAPTGCFEGKCLWWKPVGYACDSDTWVLYTNICGGCSCVRPVCNPLAVDPACTPQLYGPFVYTCCTGTTSTTTTTTTTSCGACIWIWHNFPPGWILLTEGCTGGCSCTNPPTVGDYEEEERTTVCNP